MRALLDANLFISYLLSANPAGSAVGASLAAAIRRRFTLLSTPALEEEIRTTVAHRSDLTAKMVQVDRDGFLKNLAATAEPIPDLLGKFPSVSRDRKDDYLIAHAIAGGADYLVSWDKDLLVLDTVDGVQIVGPPEFLRVLREAGRW